MALHSLYCADVPWRNCSLTHLQPHRSKAPSTKYPLYFSLCIL